MKHTCGAHTVAPSFLFFGKTERKPNETTGPMGRGEVGNGGGREQHHTPPPPPSPPSIIKQNERISIVTMENLSNNMK